MHHGELFTQVVFNTWMLYMSMLKFAIALKNRKWQWKSLILAHSIVVSFLMYSSIVSLSKKGKSEVEIESEKAIWK